VDPRLPLLIRLHLGAHRATLLLERLARELLDAVAWAWTRPDRRDAVTGAIYARASTYLRGGEAFQRGLASWELDGLGRPEWPGAGRVLVCGAGGGREVLALATRGYVVRAFEPLPSFAAACAEECRLAGVASCLEGSYADLVEAVRHRSGPLAPLAAGPEFDAVLLGWASLAHVTEPERVEAVLEAVQRLCPRGPVFTSFYTADSVGMATGRARRLGEVLGRIFSALGAPGRRPERGVFHPRGGFLLTSSAEELAAMAGRHGYRVAAVSTLAPQPWALLVPEAAGNAIRPPGPGGAL